MNGSIQVYYGEGRGKSTAVLGLGIRVASSGKQVIMVQFLRCKHSDTLDYLKKLEPELQIFRFESGSINYANLSDEMKKEQISNIKMALAYARKVMGTGQCDLLILDGIMDLISLDIISVEELTELISKKDETMDLIITGRQLPQPVRELAECIYNISTEKEQKPGMLDSDICR